ncbi:MAG TPA: cytochrome c oxidase accessory protein CcoG [Steroidobacteraceae bacterium]|nr:cytochrome c oxidase accessory protein CcoG [Steroidobacteraceae bacterium]
MNANPQPDALYVAHQKIYARESTGRFTRLRTAAVWLLLGLFYVIPWLEWHGRQAVLFDLPARKFYIFGLVFWPQDFFFLAWLLIIAALSLFFFTALAGRLWCGYACPQTVWTNVFVWLERLAEGNRSQQMKLDQAPWSWQKLRRKATKQVLWVSLAAWTGLTFVGFFTPVGRLLDAVLTLRAGPWELFWIVFYGFATYGNAGYLREQVCKYMCPYARFQSAMFDRDSLIISYDPKRGEPRGARPRGVAPRSRGLGDCIDCTLCVQVCPTGIDIREGLQYECIACAACIDVCDSVMERMNYPRGLIRYATERSMAGGTTRLWRPRMAVYGSLLGVLVVAFFVAIGLRNPVGVDVLRDRNALYRSLADGVIENVYAVRVLNKDDQPHRFTVSAHGLPGIAVDSELSELHVAAGEVRTVPVRLRIPHPPFSGSRPVILRVTASDESQLGAEADARFFAPSP